MKIFKILFKSYPYIICYVILYTLPLFSNNSIDASSLNEEYSLGFNIEIYEDINGSSEINDILKPEISNKFIKSNKKIINYGYSESAFWIRFVINNNLKSKKTLYLELAYPGIKQADFFIFSPNIEKYFIQNHNLLKPFHTRQIKHREFVFTLDMVNPGEHTCFVRIKSENSMIINPILFTEKGFIEKNKIENLLFGIFTGIILVMIIFNLFLFLTLRDFDYLYYIIFIFGIGLHQITFTGLAFEIIWPDFPTFNYYLQPFLIGFTVFWGIIFSKSFLMTKKFSKKINSFLIFLLFICSLLMISVLFFNLKSIALFKNIVPLVSIISVILASLISWKNKFRPTKFYLIAWSSFFIGTFIYVFRGLGFLPHNILTSNIMQISSILIIVLLSLALADRINILKKEHADAQEEIIKTQNIVLENLKKTNSLKDEYLMNTSHELRTPLFQITGIAETLLLDAGNKFNNFGKNSLMMILSTGKRLSSLINDILDYSKLKAGDLRLDINSVNIKKITDSVLFLLSEFAVNKSLTMINKIPDGMPYAMGDENRLHQIIFNLVDNAIKFTNKGCISIDAREVDNYLEITVHDTGIGIPDNKIEDIFKHFNQIGSLISQPYEGMGIGLTITKKLIELHGGMIHVESKIDEGSKFIFTCPKSSENIDSLIGKTNNSEKRNYTLSHQHIAESNYNLNLIQSDIIIENKAKTKNINANILVVDDEPINIQILLNHLNLAGYNVNTAPNGFRALELIDKKIVPDIILLDVMMPGISGLEVCKKIRENYTLYKLPIVMLTVKDQIKDMLEAFDAGANDYLTKPFDKLELLARVETLITLKKLVTEYEESRYREMQKRMNPHFLFNALHTIHALMLKKPENAEKGIIMLADIYRFIIDKSFSSLIPCEMELDFVKKYLEIEMLRFPDTLDYKLYIDGVFIDVLIPPLTLQPIIENSIKHGIRNITGGGLISIYIKRINNSIKFEVIDNGAGLKNNDIYSRSLGIIRDRLRFHYHNSDLVINNRTEGGTHTIISFNIQ